MALRLIEIILPDSNGSEARQLVNEENVLGLWEDSVADNLLIFRILVDAEKAELIMDVFEKRFARLEAFRLILLPVEASIPLPAQDVTKPANTEQAKQIDTVRKEPLRISRQELYAEIMDSSKLSRGYIAMVCLSSVVAAIGLMRENVFVLIGAMVIAPLLGPNVALSLATTLGDSKMGRNALRTSLVGIFFALVLSFFLGLTLNINPENSEILNRTHVAVSDIVLALASGAAGTLAFTTGASAALIGVMVAVALLPPLVTVGLLLGAGKNIMALGALLLFMANIICVNLAGVATFLLQGIRPLAWWEKDKAKKATKIAIILWVVLLAILATIIYSQGS